MSDTDTPLRNDPGRDASATGCRETSRTPPGIRRRASSDSPNPSADPTRTPNSRVYLGRRTARRDVTLRSTNRIPEPAKRLASCVSQSRWNRLAGTRRSTPCLEVLAAPQAGFTKPGKDSIAHRIFARARRTCASVTQPAREMVAHSGGCRCGPRRLQARVKPRHERRVHLERGRPRAIPAMTDVRRDRASESRTHHR